MASIDTLNVGSVAYDIEATKLKTARNIQTNLASSAAASFDGSAAANPGVTGVLPVANGGTGKTTAADLALAVGNAFGASSTPAATAAKTVTLAGFTRTVGGAVSVDFTYANTAPNPTLDFGSTGAAPIWDCRTNAAPAAGAMGTGVHDFVFNGTQWVLLNPRPSGTGASVTGTTLYL